MGVKRVWGMIDARPVVFPARAADASMALVEWDVPLAAAADLVPEEAFEIVPTERGLGRVTLLLADYRISDWQPSAYAGLTVPVRPRGDTSSPPGIRLCHGVTNAAFTDEVMYWALGVSGALGTLDVTYGEDEVAFRVVTGGEQQLRARVPRPADPVPGEDFRTYVYTSEGRTPQRVLYELDVPVGHIDPDDIHLEVGHGRLADAIRRLCLGQRPISCVWGERLGMTINRPSPLVVPTPPRA